jgi:ribosomal protein S18 acetylase RimI-like enzyme
VSEGLWPYYARPRLGEGAFTPADVEAVRARQRELGQPESFEWVHEVTPGLIGAVRAAGLDALAAPLMAMDDFVPRPDERVRLLDADDPALAASRAVAEVAFAAEGTAVGPQGPAERDAALEPATDFIRDRLRRRLTVTAVAETADGVVASGSHQPVGDVTEVVGVATLPCARRQGLGAAVTGALVADALEHGAEIVFISAGSEEIARVYGRLGFRRVGTAYIVG